MIIKESVKMNIAVKTHPKGIEKVVKDLIDEVSSYEKVEGAKNVLIIGGSSGYGLATRAVASEVLGANTYNVHFELEPVKKKTGTAGYWNAKYFVENASNNNYNFNVDAFSKETKENIVNFLRDKCVKVDLVVYSLAAGARPKGEELIKSTLKPIGKTIHGKSIDIGKGAVMELEVTPANKEEIEDTVYVMGGSDWYDWIKVLKEADVLTDDAKTISYTYIGGECTQDIYRNGTIGEAKKDLEKTAKDINQLGVKSDIVSAKAITTKASVFIPSMPIYAGCLYDVMKKHNVHETTQEHIYRLFKDMLYGVNLNMDDEGRIRLDSYELEDNIQSETLALMKTLTDENMFELNGIREFIDEFYQINGFRVEGIDYEEDIDLDTLK